MLTMYTLGFIFSNDLRKVYLLRKTHPTWQKGLLNGFGGVCSESEDFSVTMRAKAKAEGGYDQKFSYCGNLNGKMWSCSVYYSVMPIDCTPPCTQTDEIVECIEIKDLLTYTNQMVSDLPWLILAALTHRRNEGRYFRFWVEY